MREKAKKIILGASIGDCIHVAGVLNFLDLAKTIEYDAVFLDSAVSVNELIKNIRKRDPEMVAISYRLSLKSCGVLLNKFKNGISQQNLSDRDHI